MIGYTEKGKRWQVWFFMRKKLALIIAVFLLVNFTYADLRSAADSIKLEIEENPDDFKSYFDLGLCYIAIDEYEEALTAFERTLELNSEYDLARYKIALVYYAMDSLETAKLKFEELKETSYDKKAINYWLRSTYKMCGKIDAMHGHLDSAITNYQKSIKLYRRTWGLKRELAMVYWKSGDTLEAYNWFDRALEDVAYYELGSTTNKWYKAICLYDLTKFNEAIELNSSILDSDTSGLVLFNHGVFKIAAGRPEGFDDIEQACTIDTTGFVSSVYNAINAILVDSLSNTVVLLQQNIDGLQKSGVAKGLLAWTLEKLGKEGEAKQLWIKCYGQLPLGTDIESMRDFIERFIKTIKENQQ